MNHQPKTKPCVCKVKTQVETKSVGCGTDHVLRKSKAKSAEETTIHKQYL